MLKRSAVFSMICLLAISLSAGKSLASGEARTTIWLGPSAKVARGGALIERGQITRGVALIKRALEDDLHHLDLAAAHNNLCAADLARKLYRDAVDRCTRAIRLQPNMWEAYNNRANASFGLGLFDEAINDYNRAVDIRPDKDIITFNLFLAMERKRLGGKPVVTEQDG